VATLWAVTRDMKRCQVKVKLYMVLHYSAACMSHTRDLKPFTLSEVATDSDWHESVISHCIMCLSVSHSTREQMNPQSSQQTPLRHCSNYPLWAIAPWGP